MAGGKRGLTSAPKKTTCSQASSLCMRACARLTCLDLYECQVGDGGAIALSGSLCAEHCALTTLQLGSNNIGDPGALALARPCTRPRVPLSTLLYGEKGY